MFECNGKLARKFGRVIFAIGLFGLCSEASANVRFCSYNFLFYSSSEFATRDPNLRTVLAAINPDILCAQEIANTTAANNIVSSVLNGAGGPGVGDPFVRASFTDTSDDLDDALLFRSSKFTEITASYVLINTSGSPRPAKRWRLRPVSDPSGANDIYIYGVHLKASNTSPDAADRAAQAADMRANANSLPAGSNFIFCGDFNLYTSAELAYQHFVESQADNDGRAWDALNPSNVLQVWSAHSSFASIHTQSPYLDNPGAPSGATGGGMDDRFDFILISSSLHDGAGQDYVANSYKCFGNDGAHYNKDINDPPTIPQGAAMADALHSSSDHLPVYLDFSDAVSQPVISVSPTFVGFPQVLVGGNVTADLTVSNTAAPPGVALQYSFTPPAGFSAPAGTFQLNPSTNALHTLTLTDNATSGTKIGTLQINNNSATNPKNVTLLAIVLDHAVPSLQPSAIQTIGSLDFGDVNSNSTAQEGITLFNADVPQYPDNVDLRIDGGVVSNDAQNRFSLVGFAPPITAIGVSTDVTVQFDATGAAPGAYTATLTFSTSDDSIEIGATTLSDVVINLQANVPGTGPMRGDFDANLNVGFEDIDPFVNVLLDPDSATPDQIYIADMNEDLAADARDVPGFVTALLN